MRRETVGGAIALLAAAVAVLWANSPWASSYDAVRHLESARWTSSTGPPTVPSPSSSSWPASSSSASSSSGRLRRPIDAAVPVVAAICGVAVPAAIYLLVNGLAEDGRTEGWAIPAATDIAFALAVLAVVGSNLPTALRAFLLALAVVDDLLVVAIIAVFYTDELDLIWFAAAAVGCVVVGAPPAVPGAGLAGRTCPLAVFVWWGVHESGVHATIAGMVLALLTRVRPRPVRVGAARPSTSSTCSRPISSSLAVPFFALLSAGVVARGRVRPDLGPGGDRRGARPGPRQADRRLPGAYAVTRLPTPASARR